MLHVPVRQQQSASVRSQLYRCLYHARRPYTRQGLARHCGISMPTLYQNLSELMDEGLIQESGTAGSTGGRKAQRLAMVPDARFAVGISVTERRLRLVAVDLKLGELAYRELPCQVSGLTEGPEALPRALEEFLDDSGLQRQRLLGVGITVPGIVTAECDAVIYAPTLRMRNMPLTELLERIPYPAYVDNDASCSGFAEWYIRGGPRNMAYLSLENGVGGMLMLGGVPYEGDHRRGGEFGHICVEPGGLPCSCGQRGCLEAYCSARRISNELGLTLEEFFQRVEAHDLTCETLWYDVLRHLARAISNIHTAMDRSVVLGGWVSEYTPP